MSQNGPTLQIGPIAMEDVLRFFSRQRSDSNTEWYPQRPAKGYSFEIGTAYLIRTVTHYYTGRVIAVTDSDITLEDAAWIPDTGRFSECLQKGTFSEVEPYPEPVSICRQAIVDFTSWRFTLPRDAK